MVTLDDVHIDIYEGQNGPKSTLKGRVLDIKLCGSRPSGGQQGSQNQGYQQQGGQNQSNQNQGQQQVVDDLDDIPF